MSSSPVSSTLLTPSSSRSQRIRKPVAHYGKWIDSGEIDHSDDEDDERDYDEDENDESFGDKVESEREEVEEADDDGDVSAGGTEEDDEEKPKRRKAKIAKKEAAGWNFKPQKTISQSSKPAASNSRLVLPPKKKTAAVTSANEIQLAGGKKSAKSVTSENDQASGIAGTDAQRAAEEEHIDQNDLAAKADPAKPESDSTTRSAEIEKKPTPKLPKIHQAKSGARPIVLKPASSTASAKARSKPIVLAAPPRKPLLHLSSPIAISKAQPELASKSPGMLPVSAMTAQNLHKTAVIASPKKVSTGNGSVNTVKRNSSAIDDHVRACKKIIDHEAGEDPDGLQEQDNLGENGDDSGGTSASTGDLRAKHKPMKERCEKKAGAGPEVKSTEQAEHAVDSPSSHSETNFEHLDTNSENPQEAIADLAAEDIEMPSSAQKPLPSKSRRSSGGSTKRKHSTAKDAAEDSQTPKKKSAPAEKITNPYRLAILEAFVDAKYTKNIDYKSISAPNAAKLSRHWREVLSTDLMAAMAGKACKAGKAGKSAIDLATRQKIWTKVCEAYEKADWDGILAKGHEAAGVAEGAGGLNVTKLKRHFRDVMRKEGERVIGK